MRIEQLLDILKRDQSRYALEALLKPGETTSYYLGFKVGHVQCYQRIIDLITTTTDEEKLDDRDL